MNNTKLLSAIAAGALISAAAEAGVSANIGVTSNYLWRGVTQSADSPAVSGGVDYNHDSGLFAGTWASSIDFGGSETATVYDANGVELGTVETSVDNGSYELDGYFGYGGGFGDVTYKATYMYYAYPELDDSDFSEVQFMASWKLLSGGFAYTVDGDAEDVDGADLAATRAIEGDLYYWGAVNFALAEDWSLAVTAGYYDYDEDGFADTDLSYLHYQADLNKAAGDFGTFTFTVSEADEESGDDETKVIVGWKKTF